MGASAYFPDWVVARSIVAGSRISWILGSIVTVTGIVSAVLAVVALVHPSLQESGIVTLHVNPEAVIPTQVSHHARDGPLGGIAPSLPTALASAAGGISTAVDNGAGEVATAAHSVATAMVATLDVPSVSLGTRKICLDFQNQSPDCHDVPFDMTSALPAGVVDVFGDTLGMVQTLESAILGTLRQCLIAGLILVICFLVGLGWALRVLKPWSTSWTRVVVIVAGLGWLVVPFLLSVLTVISLQRKADHAVSHNPVFSIHKGDALQYVVSAFVFTLILFQASVGITFVA